MVTYRLVQAVASSLVGWTVLAVDQAGARVVWRRATKIECQAEAHRLTALEDRPRLTARSVSIPGPKL